MDADLTAAFQAVHVKLDRIERSLKIVRLQEDLEMATLDELVTEAQAQTTVVDGIVVVVEDLRSKLLAQGLDQAKIDAAFATFDANTKKIADAVLAGTPNA